MSFLLNIKPRYHQVVFRDNIGLLIEERSRGGGLKPIFND